MSKRAFRESRSGQPRYPTQRGFFARHRLALTGLGLCLLTSGAAGCGWTTMGVAALPPAPVDLRAERSGDGGVEARPQAADALAPDAEPDLRKQRPDRGIAR